MCVLFKYAELAPVPIRHILQPWLGMAGPPVRWSFDQKQIDRLMRIDREAFFEWRTSRVQQYIHDKKA